MGSELERKITSTIQQVYNSGQIEIPGRAPHALVHNISSDEGIMLRNLVADSKPKRTLEIGMGTGLSGLHICWGLAQAWGNRMIPSSETPAEERIHHLAIDPFQKGKFWQGLGLALRDQAGCDSIFDWTGERDDQALPRLLAEGHTVDFALIDGDHRFEMALLDFYYVDKLLPVGGICVIDDTDWPSVWRVVQFALHHRNYEWVDAVPIDQGPITRPWGWKLRTHRWATFRKQNWPLLEAIRRKPYQFVALRKTAEDDRPEHFWLNLEAVS